MAKNSQIAWTDHTFNPWYICTPVSPGCAHCYAAAWAKRAGKGDYRRGVPRIRSSPAKWREPLLWEQEARDFPLACPCGQRFTAAQVEALHVCPTCKLVPVARKPRVFCASLADWLDDEVPAEWLFDLITLIHKTPSLNWLLLTKRPENFTSRLTAAAAQCTVDPLDITDRIYAWLENSRFYHHVTIGTTAENQEMANRRVPLLQQIPARRRFLSMEPLLESIDLVQGTALRDIDWFILGGESGNGARPCQLEWIRKALRQVQAAGAAAFVKQLGSKPRIGVAPFACQHRKGEDPSEWPADLRVQDFPKHL